MIKLNYDSNGKIIQAYDSILECPEPYILVADDVWSGAQDKDNAIVDDMLVSTIKITQLGQLTLGYITKLNSLYPALNLLATDTIEEAKTKMISAGVTFEEAGTLITFYDKGW